MCQIKTFENQITFIFILSLKIGGVRYKELILTETIHAVPKNSVRYIGVFYESLI